MSARTARDVIAKVIHPVACKGCGICHGDADKAISALRSAGFAPPMHTGTIHKALQDAFQAGVAVGLDRERMVERKHKYCDAALNELLKAAQEDSRE